MRSQQDLRSSIYRQHGYIDNSHNFFGLTAQLSNMNRHQYIADTLKQTMLSLCVSEKELVRDCSIAQRTLKRMLSGEEDFKLSSLLAATDRLGLQLVLVPKPASAAVEAGTEVTEPVVVTVVQAALNAVYERMKKLE